MLGIRALHNALDIACLLQAKVSELEQKVAEQQRAMTVLLQDKANLESRVNIFVRVLQMRDEQIEQIRSGQRVRLVALHRPEAIACCWHPVAAGIPMDLPDSQSQSHSGHCACYRSWLPKTKMRQQSPSRMI